MTEAEWLACETPAAMLEFLRGKAGERKVRLFAAGCCRQVWHLLPDRRTRRAIAVAEEYADGLATEPEAERVGARTQSMYYGLTFQVEEPGRVTRAVSFRMGRVSSSALWSNHGGERETVTESHDVTGSDDPFEVAVMVAGNAAAAVRSLSDGGEEAEREHARRQARLARDVFGNPFRPVTVARTCLTATAVALAGAIYADRAWDRLPILADALEDAGCDSPEVLAHLRSGGPHARGCWAVDLVLGKS